MQDRSRNLRAYLVDTATGLVLGAGMGGDNAGTQEDMKRQKAAQVLAEVTGNQFPVALCQKALELTRDDQDQAFEWLFTHGEAAMKASLLKKEGKMAAST